MNDPTDPDFSPVSRSGQEERDYLLMRSEMHGQMADNADESGPRAIHLRLSQLYRERAALIVLVLPD